MKVPGSMTIENDERVPLLGIGEDNVVQTPRASRASVVCILFCELCERLAYYSISANLLIFMQNRLGFESSVALTGTYVFTGCVYFTPIIGGWLADSTLGRYNTLYLSALVYALGCILLPVVAFDFSLIGASFDQSWIRTYYITALGLIALGTGGIKANVSSFGAQQVVDLGQREVQRFFSWFYWFINIGAGIAYAFVTYIQQEVSFFIGYLIPAVSILLALLLLLIPRPFFTHERLPTKSPLSQLFSIVSNAISSRRVSIYQLPNWLDYAQITNGGSFTHHQVQQVKRVLILIPLMLTFIGFWCVHNQMQSTYILQAERMRLDIGFLKLPAASLSLFNSATIILLTPLLDLLIMPCIRRVFNIMSISSLKRIGFGFLLAIVSVLAAALLEQQRKAELQSSGGFQQEVAGKVFNSSQLSILLQVPQFVLIGSGEVFAAATGLELIFSHSPAELRSFTLGIFLAMNGLGAYLGSLLVAIVSTVTADDPWLPEDINEGHLDYFCLLLAAMSTATLILYIPLAKWYRRAYKSTIKPTNQSAVSYSPLEASDESVPSSGSVTLVTGDFSRM